MTPEHVPRWLSGVAMLGVLVVGLSVVGVLASLVTVNALLVGSAWQVAALLTAVIVALTLALVALTGGPTDRWQRTPYW
ncbi:MAG: hypothetical protein BRD23_00820 [Halobacteriales archaeon SW_9_67_25]|jgi:uncharacterized membrane protein YciS (DUF1049 family)|nr:MAG: hypothetical protein BRD23_00820 [Halobacteriales archaeon SW_9_67_25]